MKKVLLLLNKGVEIFEAAAYFDVMGWANEYGNETIELRTAALSKEVICSFRLSVNVDNLLRDINPDDFDALAMPGGFEEYGFYETAFTDEVSSLIRKFHEAGKPVSSICVGALPVAKSGVLTGKAATTYAKLGGFRRKQLASLGADVRDTLLVSEDGITTSTGPATAADVALKLLEDLTDKKNADYIRDLMGF